LQGNIGINELIITGGKAVKSSPGTTMYMTFDWIIFYIILDNTPYMQVEVAFQGIVRLLRLRKTTSMTGHTITSVVNRVAHRISQAEEVNKSGGEIR
jgi:hypothetical protein